MKIFATTIYTLAILLLLGIAGLFLASMLPIPGNIEIKIVKSGSMEPTIHTGSIVVIMPEASYQVGDVITFGADDHGRVPTTHRIVSIREEGSTIFYETKGDANEEADIAQTPLEEVIGKVIVAVPYVGYILDFARQPMGFTLMIGVPAFFIILEESFRIAGEIRNMRRSKVVKSRSAPLPAAHAYENQSAHDFSGMKLKSADSPSPTKHWHDV